MYLCGILLDIQKGKKVSKFDLKNLEKLLTGPDKDQKYLLVALQKYLQRIKEK